MLYRATAMMIQDASLKHPIEQRRPRFWWTFAVIGDQLQHCVLHDIEGMLGIVHRVVRNLKGSTFDIREKGRQGRLVIQRALPSVMNLTRGILRLNGQTPIRLNASDAPGGGQNGGRSHRPVCPSAD